MVCASVLMSEILSWHIAPIQFRDAADKLALQEKQYGYGQHTNI